MTMSVADPTVDKLYRTACIFAEWADRRDTQQRYTTLWWSLLLIGVVMVGIYNFFWQSFVVPDVVRPIKDILAELKELNSKMGIIMTQGNQPHTRY